MKFSSILTVFLFLTISFTACAQQKKAAASGKSYAKLREASVQRTLPGRQEGAIEKQYRFVITWLSATPPEIFFYRGPEAWMNCRVYRLATARETRQQAAEEISPQAVRKGDVLELRPVKGGKFPIPAALPSKYPDIILFKTNKSNWLYLAVTTVTKKPDIVMP